MGLKPRPNTRQIGNDRTATARHSFDSHKGKAFEKRRQHEHIGRAIRLHQIILADFARERHGDRTCGGSLRDSVVFRGIAMAAHQTRLYARGAGTLRQHIKRRDKAFDAFLVPDFADIQQTADAIIGHALVGGRKLLRVVSCANHKHFCGFDVKDFNDFALLLLMQSENHLERADGIHDALALKAVVAHLAQIGRMAHRSHGNVRQCFAGNGAREIQVMAYDHVRCEFHRRMRDALRKCGTELLGHGRRKVAIARGGIRHHVGHAAHIEWQRLGIEAHEIRDGALRQHRRIGRIDAGDHSGRMASRKLATHHFRQIHATSR